MGTGMRRKNGDKIPRKILEAIKEARLAATMENAGFDWPDSTMTARCRTGDFEGKPDTFIKDRTKLYRDSWIVKPLDRVIAWAEGKDKAR